MGGSLSKEVDGTAPSTAARQELAPHSVHAFRYASRHYALDVYGRQWMEVDAEEYRALKAVEDGRALPAGGLPPRLRSALRAGRFQERAVVPPPRPDEPLQLMLLNIAHACNMRCLYCYAGAGDYGRPGMMTLDTARRAVDFLVDGSGDAELVMVNMFGGEPLLNWGVLAATVEYGRRRAEAAGKRMAFGLTTNGSLLSDPVADFLARHRVNVSISLDGPAADHDRLRPYANGAPSYEDVVAGWRRLKAREYDAVRNIRPSITRLNPHFFESIIHIKSLGCDLIAPEMVKVPPGNPCLLTHRDLNVLRAQFDLLAAWSVGQLINDPSAYLPNIIAAVLVKVMDRPAARYPCTAGRTSVAVAADGAVYGCHEQVGQEHHRLGSLAAGLEPRRRQAYHEWSYETDPAHHDCWARYHCLGGCLDFGSLLADAEGRPPAFCEFLKHKLEACCHCAFILRRAAPDAMERFAPDEGPGGLVDLDGGGRGDGRG